MFSVLRLAFEFCCFSFQVIQLDTTHYTAALETVKYMRAFELLMGVKWFTTQEIEGKMKLQLSSGMLQIVDWW